MHFTFHTFDLSFNEPMTVEFKLCVDMDIDISWILFFQILYNALLRLRKTQNVCNCLCFSSSCDSASFIRNNGKFRAKNYFTDHRRTNIIHSFRDSVSVLKIHSWYKDTQKFEHFSIPIQAIQSDYSVLM